MFATENILISFNIALRKPYFIEVVGDAQDALLLSVTTPSIYFKIFTHVFFKFNQYFIENADGVIYVTKESLQKKSKKFAS